MVALVVALLPLRAQTATDASSAPSGPVIPATPSPAPNSWAPANATTTSPSPGVTVSTTKSAPPHTAPYTVVKGDSLTKLAAKFNTTRKKLEALNDLASYKLKPGQVIYVPASAKKLAAASSAKARHHATPPVDYDIPASDVCLVPGAALEWRRRCGHHLGLRQAGADRGVGFAVRDGSGPGEAEAGCHRDHGGFRRDAGAVDGADRAAAFDFAGDCDAGVYASAGG